MKKIMNFLVVTALALIVNSLGYTAERTNNNSNLDIVKQGKIAKQLPVNQFNVISAKGPALNKEFALGVSSPFCGVVNNTLVMAGGSNYPNNVIGKSEAKRFYKDIYGAVLQANKKKLAWKKIAELPEPLASGSTVATKEALYFIGGYNSKGDKSTCIELKFENNAWKCETISWLPVLISNHGSACIGDYIYVIGGLQNGKASSDMYRMNLKGDRRKWEKLPAVPEDNRIQPVVVAQKNASGRTQLYVWSGFDGWGKEAKLICGGYSFDPETNKWQGIGAPLKNEKRVYLGGGKAVALADDKIIAIGGFNYEVFLKSLVNFEDEYNKHEIEWYKHNQEIYCFNTKTKKWNNLGADINLGTVHAGIATDGRFIYNVEGELKPGTSSNMVTRLEF